jgi:Protein of unknown function (DUF3300)
MHPEILHLPQRHWRRVPVLVASSALFFTALQVGCAAQPQQPDYPPVSEVGAPPTAPATMQTSTEPPQAAPLTSQQLDQLVAPIALYPDELVAQVLAAATYPTEVVEAERWIQAHPDLKGDALGKGVDSQSWDDSVKALGQFPSVLAMMDKNLSWTSSLGEAYVNNSQGVMDAVQRMRARAQQAGNLKTTPQENVTTEGQTIVIQPVDPDVVYLPEYDPWLIYGDPIGFYPGWVGVPGLYIGGPGIVFGFGIGIGVFGGFGWGWHHWGADWHHHGIDHNHAPYVSHGSAFGHHPGGGFAHGGFHPGGGFHPSGGFHAGGFGNTHSSAFSGFNHGGVAGSFGARGRASLGGAHGGGGFHAGGGFHGGGGGGHR